MRRETPAAILIVVAELKTSRYVSSEAVRAAEIKLQIGSAGFLEAWWSVGGYCAQVRALFGVDLFPDILGQDDAIVFEVFLKDLPKFQPILARPKRGLRIKRDAQLVFVRAANAPQQLARHAIAMPVGQRLRWVNIRVDVQPFREMVDTVISSIHVRVVLIEGNLKVVGDAEFFFRTQFKPVVMPMCLPLSVRDPLFKLELVLRYSVGRVEVADSLGFSPRARCSRKNEQREEQTEEHPPRRRKWKPTGGGTG